MQIERALGRYLTQEGVITLDEAGTAGNTFLGALPSNPDVAVLIKPTGGVGLTNELDGYAEPTVQVMTRGDVHDRDAPMTLITEISARLTGLRSTYLDFQGDQEVYLVRCLALQSYPTDLGRDENERWRFSQNFTLHIHQPQNN